MLCRSVLLLAAMVWSLAIQSGEGEPVVAICDRVQGSLIVFEWSYGLSWDLGGPHVLWLRRGEGQPHCVLSGGRWGPQGDTDPELQGLSLPGCVSEFSMRHRWVFK